MKYINPKDYSNLIKALVESDMQSQQEETIPVKGTMSMKERVSNLSPDDQQKLSEYIAAIKEIKKEIYELVNKSAIKERGGDMMNLHLNPEEE